MAELTGQEFFEKRGYQKGTYEAQLASQGYNVGELIATGQYGKNINPQEYQKILSTVKSPVQQQRETALQQVQDVTAQQYQFDPSKFLPDIQKQAQAIYAPQIAQLQAIRELQTAQYEEKALETEEQFQDEMQATIESINRRGAFFGGGAVQIEGDIRSQKLRALSQLGLQAQAADFSNLAQQGLLEIEESQFIQEQLYNAETSAYSRWMDQRDFSYQSALDQYRMYTDERDFARSVFEADRSYQMSQQEMEMRQEEFKQSYDLTQEQFEMAKEEFDLDMNIKNLSYEKALDKFKSTYANTNYFPGLEDFRTQYESTGSSSKTSDYTGAMSTQVEGFDVLDPNNWLF